MLRTVLPHRDISGYIDSQGATYIVSSFVHFTEGLNGVHVLRMSQAILSVLCRAAMYRNPLWGGRIALSEPRQPAEDTHCWLALKIQLSKHSWNILIRRFAYFAPKICKQISNNPGRVCVSPVYRVYNKLTSNNLLWFFFFTLWPNAHPHDACRALGTGLLWCRSHDFFLAFCHRTVREERRLYRS